jgi:hypothetical protein
MLYVGTDNGSVLVIVDKIIIQTMQFCQEQEPNDKLLTSIIFDDYGFMAPICLRSNILYLYYVNGTFTGLNFTSPASLTSSKFDAKGRFVFTSLYQISIYN